MKLSLETDKKLNRLIPTLLKENKDISKEIKTRIKISSIFNEFEKKAKNEFNFFINDSNKRYSNAKNGQDIEQYINDSQPKYEDRFSKIMNDKFFTELNLAHEKELMKHKSMKECTKVKGIISNIRSSIDSRKIRKYLFNENNNKKLYKIYKYNKCNTENELSLNKKTIDDKIYFDNKNKNTIKNIFSLDKIKLSNSIERYKLNLNKIKIPIIKDKPDDLPDNKKLAINLPYIKMLYYHKAKPKIQLSDKKAEKVDISKLLPFSKLGRHLPKQKSENKIIKSQDMSSFMTETVNKKWNYGSTNDMVISSAKKNIRLKNNYSFKKNRIKELLDNKMPKIEEYENILKHKIETITNKRHYLNKQIYKNQRLHFLNKKELINLKIDKSIELLKEKEKEYKN